MGRFLLVTFCVSLISPCYAAMFKCKQADGSYIFSDTGCDGVEFVEKKDMPKALPDDEHAGQSSPGVMGDVGCTEEDKRMANERFAKAEELLKKRRRYEDLSSAYRELTSQYKHEMRVGKTMLSACSGVAMPEESKNQRLQMDCHTIGNSTFCN